MAELTDRQRQVLRAIHAHQLLNGYAPSIRELCDVLGISLNAVADQLRALKRKHAIDWRPHRARTLALTDDGRRELR